MLFEKSQQPFSFIFVGLSSANNEHGRQAQGQNLHRQSEDYGEACGRRYGILDKRLHIFQKGAHKVVWEQLNPPRENL